MRLLREVYQQVFVRVRTKLRRPQLIMLVAVLTGLVSGILAVFLKLSVHWIQKGIGMFNFNSYLHLLFPVAGLLLTVIIIRYMFHGYIERGIAMVLRSIARRSSFIPLSHTYLHILTSTVTVGFGGSAGLEAPIVATGSATGSTIGRVSDLTYQERTLLIACGAAAGIAAVFNAPIAGVIFAVEILLIEMLVSHFIPLIISSVTGVLCSKVVLSEDSLFNFRLTQDFDYRNVPYYILLGVLAGFVSLYYAKSFKHTESRFHHWKKSPMIKALTGGVLLAGLYFILPPLFGEGYESVKVVANGTFISFSDNTSPLSHLGDTAGILVFAGLIVLLKPVAAAITIGSGGNGGNFAPSLFTGSYLGFFFSKLLNTTPWITIPVGNFSLVGMAGVLSGVMYSPLTAIFLIAEITNGYELFIPLMIVSSISFFIVRSYEPYSMELKKLAQEGEVFTHQKEKNILTSIRLSDILHDKFETISIDKKLGDLVEIIKRSEKNIYAVLDKKGKFAGIIELNDIKQRLFESGQFDVVPIRALMKKPPAVLHENENMHSVMEKFDFTRSWFLPVLNQENYFIGFISKTKIFYKYREILSANVDIYDQKNTESRD